MKTIIEIYNPDTSHERELCGELEIEFGLNIHWLKLTIKATQGESVSFAVPAAELIKAIQVLA